MHIRAFVIILLFAFLAFLAACGGGGGDDGLSGVELNTGVTADSENTAPVVEVIQFLGVQRGQFAVSFTLSDANSDPCTITIEYSPDGGLTWTEITYAESGTYAYQASPDPEDHSIEWDSVADNVGTTQIQNNIRVRISATDGIAKSAYSISDVFTVNNYTNTPPVCVLVSPAGTLSGAITISYSLSDVESDSTGVTVEYTTDAGTTYNTATMGSGGDGITSLKTTSIGENHTFVWDSASDDVGMSFPYDTVKIRITPNDGYDPGVAVGSTSFQVNNLASGSFVFTGAMSDRRQRPALALLNNGNVLITGGMSNATDLSLPTAFNKTAEMYSVTTGRISSVGDMSEAKDGHAAVTLNDGRVLVIGGRIVGPTYTDSCDIYDPDTGLFAAAANLQTVRGFPVAHLLSNGNVLVIGGIDAGGTSLVSTEIYNPADNSYVYGPNMAIGRYLPSTVVLPSGKILVVGGIGAGGVRLSSGEVYDPDLNAFASVDNNLAQIAQEPAAAVLANGKVLLAGGHDGTNPRAESSEYNAGLGVNGQFASVGNMAVTRNGAKALLLSSGKVIIFGGVSAGGAYVNSTEIYDPTAKTFSAGPNMYAKRGYYGSVVLQNGYFFMAGGRYGGNTEIHTYTEIYVP